MEVDGGVRDVEVGGGGATGVAGGRQQALLSAIVFRIQLKQPPASLRHQMRVFELGRNFNWPRARRQIHKKPSHCHLASLASGSSQSPNMPAKSSQNPTGHEADPPKITGASSLATKPLEESPTKTMGDLSNSALLPSTMTTPPSVTKQPTATGSSTHVTEPKSDRKRSPSTRSNVDDAEPKPNRKRATATKVKPSAANELFKQI